MKFAIASVALFVATAVGQALQINTPANVVECQPTLLTWSGGTPPYFLSILPGNSPSSPALQDLGQQTGTSLTWTANIQAGTSIGLTLRDSTGAIAQSAAFTINPGTSTCLTSSGSSSVVGSSSVSGSAVSTEASTTPAATTPAATTPAATTPATSPSSTKPTSSSSGTSRSGTATGAAAATSSGAAKANVANMGVAGIVGAAVMAILA